MIKKILNKIKRIKHHYIYKLFFSYLIFILIAFTIILMITRQHLMEKEVDQGIYTYTSVLDQAGNYINFRTLEVRGIVDTITNLNNIEKVLKEGNKYYSNSVNNWNINTSNGHKQITYNLYSSSSITDIQLFSLSGQLAFQESDIYSTLTDSEKKTVDQQISKMQGMCCWIPIREMYGEDNFINEVLYMRRLPSLTHFGAYVGFVTAKVPASAFENILSQMLVTPGTKAFLYNSYGQIIAGDDSDDLTIQEIISQIRRSKTLDSGNLKRIVFDDTTYLSGIRKISGTDWTLVIAVPYGDITSTINHFMLQFMLMVMAVVIASLPVIYYISKLLSGRIVALKNEMVLFSENIEHNAMLPSTHDEIGDLTVSFYTMRENIRDLMEQQYHNGMEIKDLELQILQSQINPHFLYNTLETIYWMGIKNNAAEVSELAEKLGSFYKLSLSNGKTLVPLSTEIKHVKDYTDIQNIRYGNRINIKVIVPEYLMNYEIIKITLQPLVENAIQHGIREKTDENGTIIIDANIDNTGTKQQLIITISDDGVGMTNEQMAKMLMKNTKINGHGYGVWNINERIRMTYGNEYGLHYDSSIGKGTRVTITIPARPYIEEDR